MNRLVPVLALTWGCGSPSVIDSAGDATSGGTMATGSGTAGIGLEPPPMLDGPCALDVVEPTRLLVTTTDFATGAISVVDVETRTVALDVALGTTDAIPFWRGDRAYIVHRYQHDYIDALDPSDAWRSLAEFPIDDDGLSSTNPQCLAFGPDGLARVPLFATPEIRVLDLARGPTDAQVGAIDLAGFADADGNPEASHCVACGATLFVSLQRLGADYQPVDHDHLAAIDMASGTPYDFDPDRAGLQGIELGGEYLKQLRRDPKDPDGHTLLALTTGIERVELGTGEVSWAVDRASFAAAGIDDRLLPQSFDIDASGTMAYLAAYEADFSTVRLLRVGLDGREPTIPESFADGFDSVERTLEVVGEILWYGSTTNGEPGMWSFDLSGPVPVALEDVPLSTGLPPYSLIAIP